MANYWIFNVPAGTATPMDLQPGTVLAPPSVDNGVLPMSAVGLQIVIGQLVSAFAPRDGETQAEANERLRLTVTGAAAPEDLFAAFGFTVEEPEL